jgi:hypothetical protein
MSLSFPLTTMEEFLYWEDRPSYPWSCFIRLGFAGRLDRKAFDAALQVVLPRHPMLTAKVKDAGLRGLRWTVVDKPSPLIVWETAPLGDGLPLATHLDLRQEIGIRFHVRLDESASDLTIQFHHSCCDGAGIALFIRELLVAYAVAFGAKAKRELPELDPALLAGRGRFGLTFGKLLRMAPKQARGLLGVRQFLMRKPAPIIPHQAVSNDGPVPANYPATLHHVFDLETTGALRKAAARRGVTPNDILTRDLFLALGDWRTKQELDGDGQWLRMMIPMNLRNTSDRLMPAADVVSSVFLDRRQSDFAAPDRLLQSIHEEMDLIKRLELGFTFIFSTAICRRLPGGLKRQIRADKCTISCIFTNLGTPFAHVPLPQQDRFIVAGNVTMVDVDVVAPVRPYSCATVAAWLYAHKLHLTLHYDPRPLSAAQAANLLSTFVRNVHASTEG